MEYTKKLPETEYDVMSAIWESDSLPVTTAYLMEKVGNAKGWKAPTLISFLVRLEDRGYIRSEKSGKERMYFPNAEKNAYIRSITTEFLDRYHGGSFVGMLEMLYENKHLSGNDIDRMLEWLKTKY